MEKYEVDFAALDAAGKREFLSTFGVMGYGPAAEFQEGLFALLAYTRLYNDFKKSKEAPPEIVPLVFDRLWSCMGTGELAISPELEDFQECLEHCVGAFVNGDLGMLDSDEDDAFYAQYFEGCGHRWEGFLDGLGHLCFDIVGRTGCAPERIGELIEWTIEPDIERRVLGLESLTGTSSQQEAWAARARETPEFCAAIARLQEDQKAAASGVSIPELRARYQALALFSEPSQCGGDTL